MAARRQLEEFLARRLAGNAESRSEPAPPEALRQSELSSYLHLGHISIETVVERALSTTDHWTPMNLEPRMAGRREGFYTRNADVGAFLDEAITWRDLGYHWHWSRRKDTESIERALPGWALKTLAEHADDEREYVYTPADWEAGAASERQVLARIRYMSSAQHGEEVPPRTLSRLRGQPAQARLIAPSGGRSSPA